MSSGTTSTGDIYDTVASKLLDESRRIGNKLSTHEVITFTPNVQLYIEDRLLQELSKKRLETTKFIQQRKMGYDEMNEKISGSVNEIYSSLVSFVINDHRKHIEKEDVDEVLKMLFKLCLYPIPFWFGR